MQEKDINEVIGQNLMLLRKNKKLTQLELAEKFNYSDKSISKWEKGESLPSIEVLKQLANFYSVSLDDLTSEYFEINSTTEIEPTQENTKNKTKEKTPRMFSTKIMITLLGISAVWLIATILFVIFKLTLGRNYFTCFIWAIPASFIVATVFNSVWGRMRYLFPILTGLLWSLLVALHIQILLIGFNIWPIYILGCPLQLLIILWGALIKKPKGYYKNLFNKNKSSEHAQHDKSDKS